MFPSAPLSHFKLLHRLKVATLKLAWSCFWLGLLTVLPPPQTLGIASSAKFSSLPYSSCVPAVPLSFDARRYFHWELQRQLCKLGGGMELSLLPRVAGALGNTLLSLWVTLVNVCCPKLSVLVYFEQTALSSHRATVYTAQIFNQGADTLRFTLGSFRSSLQAAGLFQSNLRRI